LASARLGNAAELEHLRPGGLREALEDGHLNWREPRRLWDWEFIAQSAAEHGLLDGRRNALGIGVGGEPLIFFFARHARAVIATDLYSADSAWGDARIEDSKAIFGVSPFHYPRERVQVRNADMRALPFGDEQFDFCWSCSSIEHVDNLAQTVAVYNELARVLKPGGYAILTTEFCLTPPYPLPGVMALDAKLFAQIVQAHPAFDLIGPVDLGYNALHLGNAPEARRFDARSRVNRMGSLYYFPAGRMAQMCGLSVIVPIGFVLVKRRGGRPADWRRLGLAEPLVELTEALLALDRGAPADAAALLCGLRDASTPQFQMIAHRYHLDAVLRMAAPADVVGAAEDSFLAALPAGELQDPDNIELLAFSLGERGRNEKAAATYRKAAASPSAFTDHSIHLSLRHLMQAQLAGSTGEALDFLVVTVTDMLDHGVSWARLGPLIREGLASQPDMAALVAEALATARRQALEQWVSDYAL
jgi:SAM-dependent methyltransferase